MLMVCHHLDSSVPEDLAFAESRIRPTTIAAEDLLHDLGAISMIGSDAEAMGRVGEVVLRTWQTAHVMKQRRGSLAGDGAADNLRARRYVAKYTICPAAAHGIDGEVGSVEPGKLADLVLWEPKFFGVRPDRKSTRLNSSHANTSYAVFCLKIHNSRYAQPSDAAPGSNPSRAAPRSGHFLLQRQKPQTHVMTTTLSSFFSYLNNRASRFETS